MEQYQSLYRRYRPQRFDEVRGQDHVTRALRKSVREGQVAHAYLFSGPRGTGKTSTARILAMALNCENPQDGEPDGTCASCVEIRRGSSVNVHELDAASNRKLDEMRDLLARVALATPGRWKVYIVDEVHQLTPDAASALLKTLEEPPAHVVFVLATTDPQKVLPTIKSRTQHYEFHLLPAGVLGELVSDVSKQAGLDLSSELIEGVVQRGRGSARDALSVLDQVAAAGGLEEESESAGGIIDALADQDAGRVLIAVAQAVAAGSDPRRLASDLLDHLRNTFLATQAPTLVSATGEALASLTDQARRLGLAMVVRAMELIGQAITDMRDSVDPRINLEVALVRLVGSGVGPASPPIAAPRSAPGPIGAPAGMDAARAALGAHRASGSRSGSEGVGLVGAPATGGSESASASAVVPAAAAVSAAAVSAGPVGDSPAGPFPTRDELTKAWGDVVLPKLAQSVKAFLASGRFTAVEGSSAVFALPSRMYLQRAEPVRAEAEAALSAHFGTRVPLRLVLDEWTPGSTKVVADPAEEELELFDVEDLEDAGPALVSLEQRLLEAFPGAEEVEP